ncbi:hypothetical protein DFH94DRAFT_349982 [Russula ochroleuca]|uniref:Uncharacterized protein n=1 Tax=Russula ochroleuca TaxID=152965 RepID=A0A9P5MPT6_9AGAM|nr:hypothetical protein DFH94DRAFT_349982 [Russula ochroleuca]
MQNMWCSVHTRMCTLCLLSSLWFLSSLLLADADSSPNALSPCSLPPLRAPSSSPSHDCTDHYNHHPGPPNIQISLFGTDSSYSTRIARMEPETLYSNGSLHRRLKSRLPTNWKYIYPLKATGVLYTPFPTCILIWHIQFSSFWIAREHKLHINCTGKGPIVPDVSRSDNIAPQHLGWNFLCTTFWGTVKKSRSKDYTWTCRWSVAPYHNTAQMDCP